MYFDDTMFRPPIKTPHLQQNRDWTYVCQSKSKITSIFVAEDRMNGDGVEDTQYHYRVASTECVRV